MEPLYDNTGVITDFDYIYQYKDHLGNIRLSYKNVGTASTVDLEIQEENNYYPFGLEHKGYNSVVNGAENNYQTYQGQELEEELGKNTLAFQWRDYDPAIARFNKIDRYAEKYQSINPYHFTANNPIFFREIKGDSINVTDLYRTNEDGSFVNPTQVKAFEAFAGTKAGKKYLSKFASKGQKIAGVEFDSDGEYHEGGIDLNFDTDLSRNDGRDGETSVGEDNNGEADSNGRFQIDISFGPSNGDYGALEALTHEFFIHGINDAIDILDNKILDHSNIDKDIREGNRAMSRHHLQENRNAHKNKSLFGTHGYQLLRQGNAKLKSNKTDTEIWNSMWGFLY